MRPRCACTFAKEKFKQLTQSSLNPMSMSLYVYIPLGLGFILLAAVSVNVCNV